MNHRDLSEQSQLRTSVERFAVKLHDTLIGMFNSR